MIDKQYVRPKRLLRILNECRNELGLTPFKNWESVRHKLKQGGCKTIKQSSRTFLYNIHSAVKVLELKCTTKKKKGTLNRYKGLVQAHKKNKLYAEAEKRSYYPEYLQTQEAFSLFNAIRLALGRPTFRHSQGLYRFFKDNNVERKKGKYANYYKAAEVIALAYRPRFHNKRIMFLSVLPEATPEIMKDPEYITMLAFSKLSDIAYDTIRKNIHHGNIVAYKSPQGVLLHTPTTAAFFLDRAKEHPHSFKKKKHHHA